MITIRVPEPNWRGRYAKYVLLNGHIPGVLSGAELVGNAKKYGASYAIQRKKAESYLIKYGIESRLVLVGKPKRWSRVWVEIATGKPVKIEFI